MNCNADFPDVDARLKELIAIACKCPPVRDEQGKLLNPQPDPYLRDQNGNIIGVRPGYRARQRALNEVVRLVTPKLWKDYQDPDYSDAVQKTLLYLCQNFDKYDPSRASVITWLNNRLKFILIEIKLGRGKQRSKYISTNQEGLEIEIPCYDPEVTDLPNLIEAVRTWAEVDETGKLRAEHVRDRPDLNSQMLILARIPPEVEWKILAKRHKCPLQTLARFYQRKSIVHIQRFCIERGYH